MDWTATKTAITPDGYGFIVDAEATDGVETKTRQFRGIVSQEGADSAIRAWVHSLQLTPPTTGAVELNPATPEPPAPTAKEVAKADFDASVNEYKYLKEMNAILPAVFTQWMLDNQVVICQQKYQTWQNTP
jgi:hypothetical protein